MFTKEASSQPSGHGPTPELFIGVGKIFLTLSFCPKPDVKVVKKLSKIIDRGEDIIFVIITTMCAVRTTYTKCSGALKISFLPKVIIIIIVIIQHCL